MRLNMIRTVLIFSIAIFLVASCATDKNFKTEQSFTPAEFIISDVFVNITDGVENGQRIRKLMRNAGKNTSQLFNQGISKDSTSYPLEIEVTEINYRNPSSSAASGDRTYIRYSATLRDEESGLVFRNLPITYYHVSASKVLTDEAKQNAEKNMIRNSIKTAFTRLYGMQAVPNNVQTYFNTKDVFSGKELSTKKIVPASVEPKPIAPTVQTPAPAQPQVVEIKPVAEPEPIVISAPQVTVVDSASATGEPKVITCVVC